MTKTNKLKAVWLKRLIAAMRTGKFTSDDRIKMGDVTTCMVAELKAPRRTQDDGKWSALWKFGDQASDAIFENDISRALENYYQVEREAIRLELIEAN